MCGRDFLRFRHGERRFLDGNGRSYAGLPVEDFRNISRQTDAAMGNRMPPNFPYMQAQPRVGKTLPIRHGRAVKTTSLRYGIRGFGIVVDAFAFGIIHFAVEVGSMVFLFGDNGVVPRFGRIAFTPEERGKSMATKPSTRYWPRCSSRQTKIFRDFFGWRFNKVSSL